MNHHPAALGCDVEGDTTSQSVTININEQQLRIIIQVEQN